MSYKTLLVHLNDERRLPAVLAPAIGIARANGAHLIGLAVLPPIIIVPGTEGGPTTVIEEHRVAYRAQMNRMKAAFESSTRFPDLVAEWRELDAQDINPFGNVAGVVVDQARSADLVVVGQVNPEWGLSGYLDVGETVILESGRPVLMVPKAGHKSGSASGIGKRILVAWNGRREAARAAFDAVPLLRAADEVVVAWVNAHEEKNAAGDLPGADLCKALARHGVKCRVLEPIHAAKGVGSTVLATADSEHCDMLVMGCYGHSRLRELVFGGASQHVLQHMNLSVLMSH